MKRFLTFIIAIAGFVAAGAQTNPQIIPQPQSYVAGHGSFDIAGITIKCDPAIGEKAVAMVSDFAEALSASSGMKSPIRP